jgi:hypothetical protein
VALEPARGVDGADREQLRADEDLARHTEPELRERGLRVGREEAAAGLLGG